MTTLPPSLEPGETGAGNEARTRDLNLGKVALYQLSYSRIERGAIVDAARDKSSVQARLPGAANDP